MDYAELKAEKEAREKAESERRLEEKVSFFCPAGS
jgi:hypothetical protein